MQSGWRSSQLSSLTRKAPGYSLTEPSISWKIVVLSPSICILLNHGPGSPKNTRDVIYSRGMEWYRHTFEAAQSGFCAHMHFSLIQLERPLTTWLPVFDFDKLSLNNKVDWLDDFLTHSTRGLVVVRTDRMLQLIASIYIKITLCKFKFLFCVFHTEADSQVRGQRWCQWCYCWGSSATSCWAWSQKHWCAVPLVLCTSEMCNSACWLARHRFAFPG